MLKPLNEFSPTEQLAAIFRGWCAVCPETGAYMLASNGRSRSGRGRKYFLIIPHQSIEKRGGLFEYADDYDRKIFRAWSDEEAIRVANEKLSRIKE